jgi:alkane 1-monooxygenase
MKYLLAYTIPIIGFLGIYFQSFWSYSVIIYAFIIIPVLELFLPSNEKNYSKEEVNSRLKNKFFDVILYFNVPIVYGCLVYTLIKITTHHLQNYELKQKIMQNLWHGKLN